jgi:heme-degrading monooxygenase HmoA
MITRFVKLTFKEDKIEDFIKIWNESRNKIAAFYGCNFVEMHQARVPDNVCFTHSVWESEEALNAYRHSELFQNTWAKTKVLFNDRPEAWSLNTHGHEGSIGK